MTALRSIVQDTGLSRNSRTGDNILSSLMEYIDATDAAVTMTVAIMQGGIVRYSAFSVGRVVTTDTAVAILAANPWMDIGDAFMVFVSVGTANAATLAAGAGVTLAGKATVPASGFAALLFRKTGAATMTVTVL